LAAAAAEQGYGRAYYNLGVVSGGEGRKQNYSEALKYFEKGAAARDTARKTIWDTFTTTALG
jgi:TPR repeat protein